MELHRQSKGFDAIGLVQSSGLGNAFAMNAGSLLSACPTEIHDIAEIGPKRYRHTYVHGLPGQTQHVLNQMPRAELGLGDVIGFWVCESTELSDDYRKFIGTFSELWTASEYCKEILEQLGKPVTVIPHCVTSVKWRPVANPVFTFLTMADYHSRIVRKNPFGVVEAFKKAFGKSQDVRLVIKLRNMPAAFRGMFMREADNYNIDVIDEDLNMTNLDQLWLQSDCFVSMHKAEGFGLNMLEAMSYGKLVIGTGYSGNMDFMNTENSFPINYKMIDCDDEFYSGQWAMPDMDHTIELMRKAVEDNLEMRKKAFETALEFSPLKTLKAVMKAIDV